MGSRIPEFVTRRLASSVTGTTGTLGVDSSRSRMFGEISNAAARTFNALASQAAQNQVVTQSIEADKIVRQYESKAEQGIGVIQKAFAQRPADSIEAVDREGDRALQETLADIKSPRLQAMVSSRITTMNRTLRKGMKGWANDQSIRNAMVDFSSIDNTEAGELEQNPSMDALNVSLARNTARLPTANQLFSPSGATTAIRNGMESRAKGTLFGFMRTDPEEGKRALDAGEFNDFLPPNDIKKFKSDMQNAIEGKNVLTNLEAVFDDNGVLDGFQKQVASGNYKPLELEAKRDELEEAGTLTPQRARFFKHALGLVRTKRYLNSEDNIDTLSGLLSNYEAMKEDLKEGGKAQSSLDQMLFFKADIVESLDKQLITPDKAAMMMSLVKVPIEAKTQMLGEEKGAGTLENITTFGTPLFQGVINKLFGAASKSSDIRGFKKIDQYIEGRGIQGREQQKLNVKLKVNLLSEMQKLENLSPDGTVTDDQVSNILTKLLAHEGQEAGVANISNESSKLRYDNVTGEYQKQRPDGSWEVVK